MGDRTRREDGDREGGSDQDAAELEPQGGSFLQRLLTNPRTRNAILQRLRAQQQRRRAAEKAGSGGDKGEGAGEGEHAEEAEAIAEAKADVAKEVREEKEKAKQSGRDADRAPLAKNDELGAEGARSHEEGEGYVRETKTSGSVVVDARDLGVKVGRDAETHGDEEAGDDYKQGTGFEGAAGIKNGQIAVEGKATQKREDEKGAHESSQSVAIENGKAKLSFGGKTETRDPADKDAKPSAKGWDAGVEIGPDSLGGELATEKENADGSKRRTKVGAELGKNEASASAARTYTDEKGRSLTISVKGGIQVSASEPVKVGEHRFIVYYVRTKSLGGGVGGGGHGMGAQLGATGSDYETGTRAFEDEDKAKEFKEHAAELLVGGEPDPRSVEGAMKIEVGESRGRGHSIGGSAGVSGAFEGASMGLSGHAQQSDEVSVRRVSETIFDVTHEQATDEGGALTGGGGGVELSRTKSANQHRSITVRFDVSTPEGKAAFEQFCRDKKVPARGGKVVGTDTGKGEESGDGVHIAPLGDDTITHRTSEDTNVDEAGKHEAYKGELEHKSDPNAIGRFLGEDKLSSSVEVTARQENDKDAGYTVTGKIGGESGDYNRNHMLHLFGTDGNERWDTSKIRPSGEWTMTTDVDKKTIRRLERLDPRFEGKSDDDKMRALSQYVADKGADAINDIEDNSRHQLNWDLELKGDKNFPGRAGREALEARMHKYGEALAATKGADGPSVANDVQAEIDQLEARRQAVASTSNYTDLPDGLRQQQLQLIDREIAGFLELRHRASVEAVKNRPGEDMLSVATRQNDAKGYANQSPEQKPLAELRDKIAMADFNIAACHKECARAEPAIRAAINHVDWHKSSAGRLVGAAGKAYSEAKSLDEPQRAAYRSLDELRMSFMKSFDDPQRALPLGQSLLTQVETYATMAANAQGKYYDAARSLVMVAKDEAMAPYADFWKDVRDTMEDQDYVAADDDLGGATSDGDSDDPPEPPPKKVSMRL